MTQLSSYERLAKLATLPGPVGNERTFPLSDVRAVLKEHDLLTEELRIREESQIPVIPRAAQAELERLRAALREIAAYEDDCIHRRMAREALR